MEALVVPLEVAAGYRGAAGQSLEVTFVRRVTCDRCKGRRCKACERVGWTARRITMPLEFPPGVGVGAVLRLDDEASVELVASGPRAEALRARRVDYEGRLFWEWDHERKARATTRRHWMIVLAGLLAFTGVAVVSWLERSPPPPPCTLDADCLSGACVLYVTKQGVESRCAPPCRTDGDCAGSLKCGTSSGRRVCLPEAVRF
jgi:hypothetical protein